mmetsp:Transcript_11284/g.25912  ORF Transcript_11284/g.25912 Transcript_11284/m.25912 type:complete len:128 (-) Transcript_11284:925-1308(-)
MSLKLVDRSPAKQFPAVSQVLTGRIVPAPELRNPLLFRPTLKSGQTKSTATNGSAMQKLANQKPLEKPNFRPHASARSCALRGDPGTGVLLEDRGVEEPEAGVLQWLSVQVPTLLHAKHQRVRQAEW